MSAPRRWLRQGYRWILALRASPWRVRYALARHGLRPAGSLRRVDPRAVRLAAVQMPLRLVERPEAYVELVVPLAREAAAAGAQLIAFPEDSAAPLIGLLPGVARLGGGRRVDEAVADLMPGARVADVLAYVGPAVRRAWLATFSGLARALGVYVHAGSAMLPEADGRVYNVAVLFAPDGRPVALQRKCHLLPLEAEWGLVPGDDLVVVDTVLGRVGLPVCMDATYWEPFRILYLRGVEVAILPTANPEEYDEWRVRRGLWARLQESPMYGVQPCLVGELWSLRLTGRAAIYAPGPLSRTGDGVLARVEKPDAPGVAVADVDLQALRDLRARRGPEHGFNAELYARYLPELYRRVARRTAERAGGDGLVAARARSRA